MKMPDIDILTNSSSHPVLNDGVLVPFTVISDVTIVLLNVLPLYVGFKQKRLFPYTVDETIIVFSLVEIISICITMPMGLISFYSSTGWKGGRWSCIFYQTVIVWSEIMAMSIITIMTMDRIACIKRLASGDNTIFKRYDLKKTRFRIMAGFILSIFIALFPVFGASPSGFSKTGLTCQSILIAKIEHTNQLSFYILFLIAGYFNIVICVVLISTIISQIVICKRRMRTGTGLVSSVTTEEGCDIERIEVKSQCREVIDSSMMVVVVATVFFITTAPTLVLVTLEKVVHSSIQKEVVLYSILITNSSGILAPLLYPLLSRRYRNQYRRFLCSVSKSLFGCPVMYEDVIQDVLPNAERMDLNEAENVTTTSSVRTNTTLNHNATFSSAHRHDNTPYGIISTVEGTTSATITGNAAHDGGFVNHAVISTEIEIDGEILEETTYITHDSDEDGNNLCLSGSRLSLMSSGSE